MSVPSGEFDGHLGSLQVTVLRPFTSFKIHEVWSLCHLPEVKGQMVLKALYSVNPGPSGCGQEQVG